MSGWINKALSIGVVVFIIFSMVACDADAEQVEKTEIILGTDDLIQVDPLVRQFNQGSEEFFVTVVEYGTQGEKSLENLKTELQTGTAPDILAMAHALWDDEINNPEHYIDFADYFAIDDEFNEECLVASVLTSIMQNGELIWLPNEFMIHTYTARTSIVGDRKSITVEEAVQYAENMGEGSTVFQEWKTPEGLLQNLSILANASLDPENNAYDFCESSYADALNMCAGQVSSVETMETLESSNQSLLHYCPLWNPSSAAQQRFIWASDYCYVGFPSSICNGSYFSSSGVSFAITRDSVNVSGAWEFIKFVLSDSVQMGTSGFPVNEFALEQVIMRAMDRNELEETDANKLKTLINETTVFEREGSHLSETVYSVGQKVLEGTLSADDAICEIQSLITVVSKRD